MGPSGAQHGDWWLTPPGHIGLAGRKKGASGVRTGCFGNRRTETERKSESKKEKERREQWERRGKRKRKR